MNINRGKCIVAWFLHNAYATTVFNKHKTVGKTASVKIHLSLDGEAEPGEPSHPTGTKV